MPNFRRFYVPNAVVFITGVTNGRRPYLGSDGNISLFWDTLQRVQRIHPFHLLAYVILPDHFHWLMRVDDETGNFSKVLHSVKRNFTLNFKRSHDIKDSFTLWQGRFWDHVVRDEDDLNHHVDYVHWNPVKHDYVCRPGDWPHSSFQHWQERGYYAPGWGDGGEPEDIKKLDFE